MTIIIIMVHTCTLLIVGTLAENSRLNRAQGVVKAYMTIMSAYRGEVPCTVTTATVSRGTVVSRASTHGRSSITHFFAILGAYHV